MTRYVAGPWNLVDGAIYAADGRVLFDDRRSDPVEILATAKLIAAAPEMAEALRDIREWIRLEHGKTPAELHRITDWHRCADQAEAALKKAGLVNK